MAVGTRRSSSHGHPLRLKVHVVVEVVRRLVVVVVVLAQRYGAEEVRLARPTGLETGRRDVAGAGGRGHRVVGLALGRGAGGGGAGVVVVVVVVGRGLGRVERWGVVREVLVQPVVHRGGGCSYGGRVRVAHAR